MANDEPPLKWGLENGEPEDSGAVVFAHDTGCIQTLSNENPDPFTLRGLRDDPNDFTYERVGVALGIPDMDDFTYFPATTELPAFVDLPKVCHFARHSEGSIESVNCRFVQGESGLVTLKAADMERVGKLLVFWLYQLMFVLLLTLECWLYLRGVGQWGNI